MDAIFTIQRGPTPLATWSIAGGDASIHPRAAQRDELLVVRETEKISFVLSAPADGREFRIRIGDLNLVDLLPDFRDAGGVLVANQLFWREFVYFESGRGLTQVAIDSQPAGAEGDEWTPLFSANVYVLPSKVGEAGYQAMTEDLRNISQSLLLDLYGKSRSTYEARFARDRRAFISWEQELESIATVLERLSSLLRSISLRPASHVRAISRRAAYWGSEKLFPRVIQQLSRSGIDPASALRPISVQMQKREERFDVQEHRLFAAFLQLLSRRATECADVAGRHAASIMGDRHFRHIPSSDGPTLYEAFDLPKIRRLERAAARASQCSALAGSLRTLPFLREVPAELAAVRGIEAVRNPEYGAALQLIRTFLLQNALWYEGEAHSDIAKLTHRLFEQWCYLRIVEAFRTLGVEFKEWNDTLRQNLRSRFVLDFDRGLTFEAALSSTLRLRLRYEPWIMGQATAEARQESLCRASSTDVAWSPDIVIECLTNSAGAWSPVYAIVLDCKYTIRAMPHHWADTNKYLQIRSTRNRRQVVRQLWLIVAGENESIQSEDPAVAFGEHGPNCPSDEDARFVLKVNPCESENPIVPAGVPGVFSRFATGTVAFLRSAFGASSV